MKCNKVLSLSKFRDFAQKLEKSQKIVLAFAGVAAVLGILLFVPTVQNLILSFAEKVILHRELAKPEKWIGVIRECAFYSICFSILFLSYYTLFEKTELIFIIIICVPLIKIIYFLVNIIGVSFVINSPNEYRDLAIYVPSYAMKNSINPYTIKGIGAYTTPMLYLYSGLNPFLSAFISNIMNISLFNATYILNLLCLIVTSVVFFIIISNFNKNRNIFDFIFSFIICSTFFSMFGTLIFTWRTDSLAICIYCAMLCLVCKNNDHPFLMACLSVSLLFTKQNQVTMVLAFFIYYLIFDRKKCLKYTICCGGVGIATLILLYLLFPLYIGETIVFQFLCIKDGLSLRSAIYNLFDFVRRYKIASLFSLAFFIYNVCLIKQKGFKIESQLQKYMIFLFINEVLAVLMLLYFAQNGGDGFKFVQEMLTPSIFLTSILGIIQILNNWNSKHTKKIIFLCFTRRVIMILIVLTSLSHFSMNKYSYEDVKELVELKTVLDNYKTDKMFLGPACNFYAISDNNFVENGFYDNGQTESFYGKTENKFLNEKLKVSEIGNIYEEYKNVINEKIANRDFDIVCGASAIVDTKILEENYVKVNSFNIRCDLQTWEVPVWERKAYSK